MKINTEVLKVRDLQGRQSDSKGRESTFRGRESDYGGCKKDYRGRKIVCRCHESAFRGCESACQALILIVEAVRVFVKVPVYGKGGGATRFSKYTGNYRLKFR